MPVILDRYDWHFLITDILFSGFFVKELGVYILGFVFLELGYMNFNVERMYILIIAIKIIEGLYKISL